jgi:hypothetical protein
VDVCHCGIGNHTDRFIDREFPGDPRCDNESGEGAEGGIKLAVDGNLFNSMNKLMLKNHVDLN